MAAGRYLLVVEGKDDKYVIENLWKRHSSQAILPFEIKPEDGVDKLLLNLRVRLKPTDEDAALQRLGIVVDADADLDARWQALCDILTKLGYANAPTQPEPNGTIIQQDERPVVGIWVMPNNQLPGILEDFIKFLIPPGDLLLGRVKDCVQQIPEQERRFPAERLSKVHVHTWLAWQEEPGKPLGQAITARYLDAHSPHAQQLMDWVRRLFDL